MRSLVRALLLLAVSSTALAQRPSLSPEVRSFVSVDDSVIALVGARVIDGTGAGAKADQTIIIANGVIRVVGDRGATPVPAGAKTIDLAGRSVLPGFVMVHEHMFYPAGNALYSSQVYSFPRLYLAGGATTVRTGGSMHPFADINLKRWIDAGIVPGPKMDVTGPYLDGPAPGLYQFHELTGPDDARRMVQFWADQGATSFKAYTHITRAELQAVVAEAHTRGLKVTGHLCSVTFAEAAALGIDNLEHGLVVNSQFAAGKQPDRCPSQQAVQASVMALDLGGAEAQGLIRDLVAKQVAITSTLTVFETFAPRRPPIPQRVLDAMLPEARLQYLRRRAAIGDSPDTSWTVLLRKEMQFEHAFAKAGGTLLVGTDPTGYGGVVAGFSNQRAVELLVESGFTPLEAIRIATLDGARFLGRADKVGSIAAGKQADLVVVRGDPSTTIADVERVELVFKDGIGYDPQRLIASAAGLVGLR
jgi:imidazolonepropionase-like amidohydrolase